jgi:hypothetical protein
MFSSCVTSRVPLVLPMRIEASEDKWMVAPWCYELLKTWCGLTIGRVLQVQVAA